MKKTNTTFDFAGMKMDQAIVHLRAQMVRAALDECSGDARRAAIRLGASGPEWLTYCQHRSREVATESRRSQQPKAKRSAPTHLRLVVNNVGRPQP